MATIDAKKTFAVTGGAVKYAASSAAFPTGPNFVFDPTIWHDLGLLKKQPSLTPKITTNTASLWNGADITLGSSEAYDLSFSSAQFDYETFKLQFNFDELDEDGGFTPGDTNWEGQLAVILFRSNDISLLHAPSATLTDKGAIDFLKNDLSELSFTFALNPDQRLGNGKPWKFFPGTPLVAQV
jgi:hypothetical protein